MGALLTLVAALPVAAQINDPSVQPENIELLPAATPILEYALAGAFLLAAMAVGFRPGKATDEKKGVRTQS